jgi:ubiquinone/menaquinone biosynthesis C-methylase UbiE
MIELTIVVHGANEPTDLQRVLREVETAATRLDVHHQVVVVSATPELEPIASECGARFVSIERAKYGATLKRGYESAQGQYVLTIDDSITGIGASVGRMWRERDSAGLVIASRYSSGSSVKTPLISRFVSAFWNRIIAGLLSIDIADLSSGVRLTRRVGEEFAELAYKGSGILVEQILNVLADGRKVKEIPADYELSGCGCSWYSLTARSLGLARHIVAMRRFRHSARFPDYDERAFDSKIPLQRYWQRRRYAIVTGFVEANVPTLDIGCGSSRIVSSMPEAVALDINASRLRYISKTNRRLTNATAGALPFRDGSFGCVICSEVIEHTEERTVFQEMRRVLRKGGILVVGTPDYGKLVWRLIERVYAIVHRGGYAEEHIERYSRDRLADQLKEHGFRILEEAYICGAELIVKAVKER